MNGLIKKGRALQAFLAALVAVVLCSFSGVASAQVRPAQCGEYARATTTTLTRGRNVSILTMLATAWEGLNDAEATGYLNRGETPRRVLLRSAWPLRDESISSAWAPPHANVPLLTMGQLVLDNPGRWTTRYHKIFVVDLPEAVHVARSLSVSVTENVRELPATPVQIGYRRDLVDVTTLGHLVDQPSASATSVEQLFTANASWFHLPTGAVTRRVSSNWKVETLTGISDRSRTFSIRRIGARRALQRSCEALPRVDGVIAGEDRAQLAELLVELDGVGSDPDAHADLQSAVTAAHARVVEALAQQLRPDREAIASANAARDGWQNAATKNAASANAWQRVFRGYRRLIIRNTIVGGSLALALIVALIGAIMWLKKRPLPPPSSEVVAEIRRAFLEEIGAELMELRNLAHAYLDTQDPMYKKVLDMSPATLIAGIMEDPAAFFAAVSRAVSAEIGRKAHRVTPPEPMPAAKAGNLVDDTLLGAIRELCFAIIAAAEIKGGLVPHTPLASLVGLAVGALPHALTKASEKALAAHTCPKVESSTGSGEHRTAKYKGTDLAEALCRKIIAFVGEKADDSTPLVDLVNAATGALNKALKKAFDDGAASREGEVDQLKKGNREAAALISSLEEALIELKKEFIAVFEAFFPGEQLALTAQGYIATPFQASHRMKKALEALRTGTMSSAALERAMDALRWLRDNNSKGPQRRLAKIKAGLGEAMTAAEVTKAAREDQPQTRPLGAVYIEAATEAGDPAKVEDDKDAADVVTAAKEIDLSNPGAVVTDEPGNGRDRSGARLSQSSPTAPPTEASSSS